MIYIDENKYVQEPAYYTAPRSKASGKSTFDSVLEAETVLYAAPAAREAQSDTAQDNSLSVPKKMEAYFERAADKYGVDINLLKAVAKAESGFNPSCVSSAGAIGVMQLMPSTASSLGVKNPYDAEENIMGGAKYLSQLLQKYDGDVSLTLAAYNAGAGNVDKYNGIPPFKETQAYVKRVLGYCKDPSALSIPNTLHATADKLPANDSSVAAVIYAVASNLTDAYDDVASPAATIYAVAAKDVTSSAHAVSISSVPKASL